jgi:octaprenyl-diphosphate synthase
MSEFDIIKYPIRKELDHFDDYFHKLMKTEVPLLNLVMQYVLKRKGKQMRPVLVLLTAKLHGEVNPSTFAAAAFIEMLHTATLIHDDVVDGANERRGFFSINALWKSKVAVLLGDYLLAKGLLLAVDQNEYELLQIVAGAVKEMSEGELMQMSNARKMNFSEESYFKIIRKKTAALISCCSASGAKSVQMLPEIVERMQRFGELLGIAFQIKDDLLDYQTNNHTGKASGNDIKEKKFTLPLIYALEHSSSADRRNILSIIHKAQHRISEIQEIHAFVSKNHGLKYAEDCMHEYSKKALFELKSYAPSPILDSLHSFVEFSIQRDH